MELRQTLRYTKNNESKRLLCGQTTLGMYEKLFHFALVFTLSAMSFGLWFVLLIFMKKRQFDPRVQIKDTNNPVDQDKVQRLITAAGYELEQNESPLILIQLKSREFLIFTDFSIYYTLNSSQKVLDSSLTSGKLDITAGSTIKTRGSMHDSLALMFGDEIVGALSDGTDSRIVNLLKEVAKDIRENSTKKGEVSGK